jgi:hypothetical protein
MARSNSWRENNCNIWLEMLDTRITVVVSSLCGYVFSTQTVAGSTAPLKTYFGQRLHVPVAHHWA